MKLVKTKKEFLNSFSLLTRKYGRYAVFSDLITMSAISIQNSMGAFLTSDRFESLESEYCSIVKKYSKDEVDLMCRLFTLIIEMVNEQGSPIDMLGPLYMELEMGSGNIGQFFTPPEISEMIARMMYSNGPQANSKPFITLQEPACGAGSMVLAFAKAMQESGSSPSEKLWVQAIDIHRITALMCYIQMSLWCIPGEVIVGNSLSQEVRESFYTPEHFLGRWNQRLLEYENHHGDEQQQNAFCYPKAA